MPYRVAVDTGGTFTDVVVVDDSGKQTIGKALTTPDRVFDGMRASLANAAGQLEKSFAELLAETTILIYGTTHSTNAFVQKKVAKTALLVTQGFPDILVIKEGGRYNAHDFSSDYPDPYIPRRHTFEITERVSSEGEAVVPLDRAQARRVLESLKARSIEAVAVSFLWSIANPENELAMGALIEEHLPGIPYTLSHKLASILREYRRTSAAAIDASLKPLMQDHLAGMERDLRDDGFVGELLISTSMGGCTHVDDVRAHPIHTLKSGPAMAPVAGRTHATIERLDQDVVVCDTGGTTFDVGLIRNGEIVHTRETWLGGQWTGHILGTSSVDIRSIGAGGGSIAWVDSGGLLRVGPESAGSDPGPACYGKGGDRPTVTDAAVVLGYLLPEHFLGGRMALDVDAARRVIADLAASLEIDVERLAYGVLHLANELMIKAIQSITVSEGLNPREATIVAGGGAAGMGVVQIARELGARQVLLPKSAGVLSAGGMQFSDIVTEHSVSCVSRTDEFDIDSVNTALDDIEAELVRFLDTITEKGFHRHSIEYLVEARYLFQVWELDVPLPFDRLRGPSDVDRLMRAFHDVHDRIYAVRDEQSPIECLNWKGRLSVKINDDPAPAVSTAGQKNLKSKQRTQAYFGGTTAVETPVFVGDDLVPGSVLQGPAIIVEPTTTIVVDERSTLRVSDASNFLIDVQP